MGPASKLTGVRLAVAATALTVFAGAAFSPPARAQAAIGEPESLTNAFTADYMSSFLTELGLTASVSDTRGGAPVYIVEVPGGGKFIAALTVCDQMAPTSCLGLYFLAYFEPAVADPAEVANRYNADYAFAKAYITRRGTPVLARYLIADGGITKANLYYNLTNFLATAKGYADELGVVPAETKLPVPGASGYAGAEPNGEIPPHLAAIGKAPSLVEQLGEDLPADAVNRPGERAAWAMPVPR